MKKLLTMLVLASLFVLPVTPVLADDSTVTADVNSYAALTLSSGYTNNVTFGALTHNTVDNDATGNGDGASSHSDYNVTVTTNTANATLQYSAVDFTGADTLSKSQFFMDTALNAAYADVCGGGEVNFASDQYVTGLVNNDVVYSNFCLDVPNLQTAGSYSSTLTVTVSV
jgi:hypothetical protein